MEQTARRLGAAGATLVMVWTAYVLGNICMSQMNGDVLFLYAFVSELRAGVPMRDWIVQPAPSFFPDGVFVLLSSLLPGGVDRGLRLYFWFSFASFFGATFACFSYSVRRSAALAAASAGCAALFAMSTASPVFQNAFLPGHHGMAIVVLLLSLALAHHQLAARVPRASVYIGIFALSAFTIASDRIFVVQGAVPLVVAIGLGAATRCIAISSLWRVAGPLVASVPAGLWLGRIPATFGLFAPPTDATFDASLDRLLRTVDMLAPFLRQFPWLAALTSAFLVLGTVFAGGAVAPRLWAHSSIARRAICGQPAHRWLTITTLLASIASTMLGVVWGGYMTDFYRVRYLDTLFVLPPLGLALLVATVRWASVAAPVAIAGAAVISIRFARENAPKQTLDPQAAVARCVDEVARKYDARFGYANYWQARSLSLRSRENVRLAHVTPDFRVHQWIGNLFWHQQASRRPGNLIVYTPNVDVAAVIRVLGQPSAIVQCEAPTYVYLNPPAARPAGVIVTRQLRPEVPLQY